MTVILEYDINDQPQAHIVAFESDDPANTCTCGSNFNRPAHKPHYKSITHMTDAERTEIGVSF